MHNILERQLKRYLGTADLESLPENYRVLIDAIDVTYGHFDDDKLLAERSLEISSRELMVANSVLSATLESTADGILVVDNDGRITLLNKRFADMWGIPQSVLDSGNDNKAIEFVLPQLVNPEQFGRKVHELYKSSDTSLDILHFKDGRIFERYSQPQVVNGKRLARVWSFRDMTRRIKSEEMLKLRAEELEKMNTLMVGRELKMIELKKELEALRQAGK